ncbi:MAG: hypothetical protein JWO56_2310 [Acidobacteria bacterium]|nr:hypothetical protein [Acidobacteriota bacterium]
MHNRIAATLLTVIVSSGVTAYAQTAPAPPPAPATTASTEAPPPPPTPVPDVAPPAPTTPPPTAATAPANTTPPALSRAASGAYERRDALPYVNVYLPEGQASIRLRKLIKNVLFESQIDYRFVNGDISTYLRYKYYARNISYKLSIFDSIGFPDIGKSSNQVFERTRGGLLLFELPRDYNNRYFWLLQDDRLTFGDLTRVDNKKNNIYTKIGYQYGTQFDERMNGIVGEQRGRITPVLTAFREIGPQKTGIAVALTESAHIGTGAYKYTKLEGEALRRFDITGTTFIVSRVHAGFFPTRSTLRGTEVDPIDRYSIPRYEMFQLGGREAMKGIHANVDSTGTHEVHEINEFFVPIFRNKDHRTWALHWNTMYGIGYLGAGTVAFDFKDLGKTDHTAVDAGLGSEMALSVRDYDVLLSVIYARTLHAPASLRGSRLLFSIRTIR